MGETVSGRRERAGPRAGGRTGTCGGAGPCGEGGTDTRYDDEPDAELDEPELDDEAEPADEPALEPDVAPADEPEPDEPEPDEPEPDVPEDDFPEPPPVVDPDPAARLSVR